MNRLIWTENEFTPLERARFYGILKSINTITKEGNELRYHSPFESLDLRLTIPEDGIMLEEVVMHFIGKGAAHLPYSSAVFESQIKVYVDRIQVHDVVITTYDSDLTKGDIQITNAGRWENRNEDRLYLDDIYEAVLHIKRMIDDNVILINGSRFESLYDLSTRDSIVNNIKLMMRSNKQLVKNGRNPNYRDLDILTTSLRHQIIVKRGKVSILDQFNLSVKEYLNFFN